MEPPNSTRGGVLRVVYARYPPFAMPNCDRFPVLKPSLSCPYPGFCVELMRAVARRIGRRIQPIVASYPFGIINWGNHNETTGEWTGILGFIANGTADTACMFYRNTASRTTDFDFTIRLYKTRTAIAVHHDDGIGPLFDFLTPFSPPTWLLLCGAILAQCVCGIVLASAESLLMHNIRCRMLDTAFTIVRMQLRQAFDSLKPSTFAGRLWLLTFGILQCMLITTLYQSVFSATTILGSTRAPYRNFDEVIAKIESGRYRFVEYAGGDWFTEQIRTSTLKRYARLREALEQYPIIHAASINESLDCIEAGKCVMSTDYDALTAYMTDAYGRRIAYVWGALPERTAHLPLLRGSPLTELLNDAIEKERIEINRLERKYYGEMYHRLRSFRYYGGHGLKPVIGLLMMLE